MTARMDPYKQFKFRLEIDGIVRAGFHECSGLHHATVEEDAAAKFPGVHKVGDVTLKRGVIGDLAILEWQRAVSEGKTQRKNGSIVLMDEMGEEKTRWNFTEGWPKKWDGPTFNANAKDLAIEKLEIAHEGLTKV